MRDIYRSRKKTGAVIGQLATIALSSMAEVLDAQMRVRVESRSCARMPHAA
jgi:hypothetical protein